MKSSVLVHLILLVTAAILASALLAAAPHEPAKASSNGFVPVVLISVDGLKPDYVLEGDKHRLRIPHLRRLVKEGAHARAVTGVVPTVTYPSHTTLVTGVSPEKHGIVANKPFDPLEKNLGGWSWYAEDIRVPTLWDAASRQGLTTASVDWPVTVGARITYNIPQYWRASTPDDGKLLRALSKPDGLLAELEAKLGPYPQGYDYSAAADQQRSKFGIHLLEQKSPRLMLCYFGGLDEVEHETGPYTPQTFSTLEQIDTLIGELRLAAEKLGQGRAVVCVVSDHGFFGVQRELRLNAVFLRERLLQVNSRGNITSWQAFAWVSGGCAAVFLNQPENSQLEDRVRVLLKRLADAPQNGIRRIVEKAEIRALKGFPGATFLVDMREGFALSGQAEGPVVKKTRSSGTHGFLPENAAMDSVFFISGPGIPAQKDLGRIDMRDIAPTLAALLGLSLPDAEGRNLFSGEANK